MEFTEKRIQNWRVIFKSELCLTEEKTEYLRRIIEHRIGVEILKDSKRSYVGKFVYGDKNLVFKIPKEKNNRLFTRLQSLLKESEAFRNFKSMERCISNNIITTIPLLAAEKRVFGMVVDSFVIYEYLEGKSIEKSNYINVIEKLKEIHRKGFMHGDPQIRNFLMVGEEVAVIDTKFERKKMGKFTDFYEYWYLQKSQSELSKLMIDEKKSIYYKIAEMYQNCLYLFKDGKKIVLKKLSKNDRSKER